MFRSPEVGLTNKQHCLKFKKTKIIKYTYTRTSMDQQSLPTMKLSLHTTEQQQHHVARCDKVSNGHHHHHHRHRHHHHHSAHNEQTCRDQQSKQSTGKGNERDIDVGNGRAASLRAFLGKPTMMITPLHIPDHRHKRLQENCLDVLPVHDLVNYVKNWIDQDGCDIEFDSVRGYENSVRRRKGEFVAGYRTENTSKNRFRNVLPSYVSLHLSIDRYCCVLKKFVR